MKLERRIGALLLAAAAAVLVRSGVAQHTRRVADGPSGGSERYGVAVIPLGDLDGDGASEYAVGAENAVAPGVGAAGRVYVHRGSDGVLLFTMSGQSAGDRFGRTLACVGDVDGDGIPDLAVGSPGADLGGIDSGSVQLRSGAGGALIRTIAGAVAGEAFGATLVALGDVDFDGAGDFGVGAPAAPPGGRVAVVGGATGIAIWGVVGAGAEECGGALAAGDADGDGDIDLFVGSPGAAALGPETGRFDAYDALTGATIGGAAGFAAGERFGAAIAFLTFTGYQGGTYIGVGAPGVDLGGGVVDAGAVYGLGWPPAAALLTVLGRTAGDRYGETLIAAADADLDNVPDFAAGAPNADRNGVDSGEVELVSGATGSTLWRKAGDSPGDRFGAALASLSFDYRTPCIAAAAPFDDNFGAADNGTVRFEALEREALPILHHLIGDGGNEDFGKTVAVVGDLDGDGADDLAVGSPADSGNGANAGAVRVYSGKSGRTLFVLRGAAGDRFGFAVDGAGDLDGDGRADLIVGAPFRSSPGFFLNGRIAAIDGDTGATIWTRDGVASNGYFGHSVSGLGDVDQDGVPDVVAGSPLENLPANVGIVRILSGATGNVVRTLSGVQIGENFGWDVDAVGDLDLDGVPDLVIGAPFYNSPGLNDDGRIEVRSGATGALIGQATGQSVGLTSLGRLGSHVARAGDVTGDGVPDILINENSTVATRVWSGAGLSPVPALSVAGTGYWAGDYDGDGRSEVFAVVYGTPNVRARLHSGVDASILDEVLLPPTTLFVNNSDLGGGDLGGDGLFDLAVGIPASMSGGVTKDHVYALSFAGAVAYGEGYQPMSSGLRLEWTPTPGGSALFGAVNVFGAAPNTFAYLAFSANPGLTVFSGAPIVISVAPGEYIYQVFAPSPAGTETFPATLWFPAFGNTTGFLQVFDVVPQAPGGIVPSNGLMVRFFP